jgi:hypothetical protein
MRTLSIASQPSVSALEPHPGKFWHFQRHDGGGAEIGSATLIAALGGKKPGISRIEDTSKVVMITGASAQKVRSVTGGISLHRRARRPARDTDLRHRVLTHVSDTVDHYSNPA